jgi:hypothetical protein
MISHPFDIRASAATQAPDELMIAWGEIPQGSVASIYLPAVAAADIIALANSMYGTHRLTATDAHTVQFPSGNVTLIPVPKGQGAYAGLLSVDLASTARRGRSYAVAVRQLTEVSAALPPPPPPIQIAVESRAREVSAPPKSFSWRQVLGAFQYTITVKPGGELLYPQERLLAWLKWRIGVTPPSSRWLPVLQRYLNLTEGLVLTLGGDPSKIPPSQTGNVPGKGPSPPVPPIGEREITGKVVAIDYDRFGDFCGFTILSEHGRERHFHAREPQIEDVVYRAWMERSVISVFAEEHDRHQPATLTLRRPH